MPTANRSSRSFRALPGEVRLTIRAAPRARWGHIRGTRRWHKRRIDSAAGHEIWNWPSARWWRGALPPPVLLVPRVIVGACGRMRRRVRGFREPPGDEAGNQSARPEARGLLLAADRAAE